MRRWLFIGSLVALLMSSISTAQSTVTQADDPNFTSTLFTDALSYGPTTLKFAPDGRLLVAQQNGIVKVFDADGNFLADFASVTTDVTQERGLLGLAFHPNFTTSDPYLYVHYTVPANGEDDPFGRVSRFAASSADPDISTGTEDVILDLDPLTNSATHNGGAIHFGADNMLYIATGDNRLPLTAQDLASTHGKILRINPDGSIPTNNPFYDTTTGIHRAIWALGFRNPFTFTFEPGTGALFVNDVGEVTMEEVSRVTAGGNYGWPYFEGDTPGDFAPPDGFTPVPPVITYTHSDAEPNGCSIAGAAFYTGTVYPAEYQGSYFYADFCAGWVRRYDPATDTNDEFLSGLGSFGPVDIDMSPAGELYYVTRAGNAVYQIENIASVVAPPAPANVNAVANNGRPTISWDANADSEWYQVWVGAPPSTNYLEWHAATTICDEFICLLDVDLVAGDYTTYVQAWGQGSFSTGGTAGWGGPADFTLSSTPPAEPDNLTAAFAEDLELNWDSVENGTWYQVWVGTDGDFQQAYFEWNVGEDMGCAFSMATCVLTLDLNLAPDEYTFFVQVWGPGGFSEWVQGMTFTVTP